MRVLITGAAGFIGSNLTKACLDAGWHVTCVDDLSNGHREFLPSPIAVRFQPNDFANSTVLDRIRRQEFDTVIHLAAVPRVSYSVLYPLRTHEVNVDKTLLLLEACKGNVNHVVFASSSSVYGGADVLPTPETFPRNPKSPYALQKAIIEDYLRLYSELYGLDSACMRFFNVFGPNQLGDSPYATAVSAWLTAIKKGVPMRSDGDGSQSRDMCYVDNVVSACMKAATYSGKLGAETFNVACGDRTTNKEILEELKRRYPGASYVDAPWRPGDVMHTQADVSKAERVLGYIPVVRFWDGLDRTIKWYEDNWSWTKVLKLHT
jgi:nucleoside-diphosphate-sugar epimerase